MPSAPSAPVTPLGRAGTKVNAWYRQDLDYPMATDEADYWHPLRIVRSAGGQSVDSIVAEYDLKKQNKRLTDIVAPAGWTTNMLAMTSQGQFPVTTLGWGVTSGPTMSLDRNTEKVVGNFRQDKHLFGIPLGGMQFSDVVAQKASPRPPWVALYQSDIEIVFNPTIRLKGGLLPVTMGNRDDQNFSPVAEPTNSPIQDVDAGFLFIDPLAFQTLNSQKELLAHAVEWKLEHATSYLCWACNEDEKHFRNPRFSALEAVFDSEPFGVNRLRNHRIRRGLYLPEALDDLLSPYGYSWFTKPIEGVTDDPHWQIVVFQRGKGTDRTLKLQKPGSASGGFDPALEIEKSNVASVGIKYDIVALANKIKAYGSRKQIECTIELMPCWAVADDNIDAPDQIFKDRPGSDAKPHVYRTWAANEAGDYTGLRPNPTDLAPTLSDRHLDLFDVLLDSPVVRRRKLLPCISREIDPTSDVKQRSRGILVEWYNESPDPDESLPDPDGPRWERVPWSFDIANDEILIHFNGESPPDQIAYGFTEHREWQLAPGVLVEPEYPRIRITATIEDDVCILAVADKLAESPQASEIVLTLDVSDRFHSRTVKQTGLFKSELRATLDPDTIDDTTKLQDFVERVRSVEDCARMEVNIVLEGLLHPDLQISDLISKIDGRDISLDANSPTQGTPRRPQIMRIEYDVAEQRTTLDLEIWDMNKSATMHG